MPDYDWGQGGKGAVQGAVTGATLGSIVPGVGTGIGALVGGGLGALGGFFGGGEDDEARRRYEEQQAILRQRLLRGSEFLPDQRDYIAQLQEQALMGDPLAREQLRQNTGRLMAQQQGIQAGAAPQNQAMAARLAAQNAAQMQAGMAGQAAQADVQARLGALGQLGGAIGQGLAQEQERNRLLAMLATGDREYARQQAGQPGVWDYALQGLSTYGQLQGMGAFGGGGGAS